ncbi:MAG: DUF2461 family protein [Sphingobacteriales bacterium]|nr:MAG: DUF2461 family protein [Sphingobacteriales bacterium]
MYYQPDVFGLQVLRSHIAKNLDSFQAIIDSLQADGFYLEQQHRLASLPKGYPENSPAAAFIKLQCYQFSSPLDLSSDRGTILSNIITSFKAGYPMVQFLRRGLGLD